ncbi:MAG: hypothetical protein EHM48_06540 [Planctomycetaceae bacterium]|nr:MAG: hypothetical protein EHM48_06540 [Planctomycetaceae bacterium]
MFRLDVLQNQWLMLAMLGGAVALLTVVLAYVAFWRKRSDAVSDTGPDSPRQPLGAWVRSFVPWILIGTFAFVAVWAVVYTIMIIKNPPNW